MWFVDGGDGGDDITAPLLMLINKTYNQLYERDVSLRRCLLEKSYLLNIPLHHVYKWTQQCNNNYNNKEDHLCLFFFIFFISYYNALSALPLR
jgi:hypothetical protein